ncbi:MAG: YncE family protein [Bryobacteraceae bacterium]
MTRRQWLAAGGAAVLASCGRKKGTGYLGYALVASAGEKAISVVDLLSFRLIRTIPLDAAPAAIVPGPGYRRIYVLTPETGSVHVLAHDLAHVGSARLSHGLSTMRLTADGKRLVATSNVANEVIDVNLETLRVNRRYKLAVQPAEMDVVSPDFAAIGSGPAGLAELFNLQSGTRRRYQFAGEIGALRFRNDGRMLLVSNLASRSLTALSVPEMQVVADLPLAMEPKNLCFNADAGQLFVSGEGMDGVAIVFPYRVLQVEQTVLAGRDPGVMAVSASPPYLFVGSASGSDVCILNIATRKVVGIVDVAQRPEFITVTPDNQYALVLDRSSGNMAIIHISAFRLDPEASRTKSGAALFTILPVGSDPVHAAVIPRSA